MAVLDMSGNGEQCDVTRTPSPSDPTGAGFPTGTFVCFILWIVCRHLEYLLLLLRSAYIYRAAFSRYGNGRRVSQTKTYAGFDSLGMVSAGF